MRRMNLLLRSGLIIIAIVGLFMIIRIECGPRYYHPTRCRDIIAALRCLQNFFPPRMPPGSRCKRYAVLLALTELQGKPHKSTVIELATIHEQIIDMLYRNMDGRRRKSLYMTAIALYRASKLEPPFVELVACLRQIDTALAGTRLDGELDLILDLYRQVVNSPALTIDLDAIDLKRFDPSFKTALRALFDKNIAVQHWRKSEILEQSKSARIQQTLERQRYRNRLNQQRFREKRQQKLKLLPKPVPTPEQLEKKERLNLRRRMRRVEMREQRLLKSARANVERAPHDSEQGTPQRTPMDHPIQKQEIPQHESPHPESLPPIHSQPYGDVAQLANRLEPIVIPTTSFPCSTQPIGTHDAAPPSLSPSFPPTC